MAIADGTMEKRDCLPSLLEQKHISLFYCNSRKAILNPHQHGSETKFRIKFLHALLFSKSGQYCAALLYLPVVAVFAVFAADADGGELVADLV